MEHFFLPKIEEVFTVEGDTYRHLTRSRRMRIGETAVFCDGSGMDYLARMTACTKDTATFEVEKRTPSVTESPLKVTLYQCLPKGDKMDTVIQKAVECGVASIVPFESERCVVRCKPEQEDKKTERRQRIATEAAKQCGRGSIPEVVPTCRFSDVLQRACAVDIPIFCYEGEDTVPLRQLLQQKRTQLPTDAAPTISIVVGSEGGFSGAEAQAAKNAGFLMAGLGRRILRTETASSFVLSALVYEFEL
jgi:16S rRNA (uracil1498-N3)-methyltransferase